MKPATAQGYAMPVRGYRPMDKPMVKEANVPKQEQILSEKERYNAKERENTLKSIEFLTKYVEDLRAGRPVENLHPDNDPYFLVPENIECIIRGERDILAGRGRIVNSLEDIIGEWDTE
jgi:hypothetical protein